LSDIELVKLPQDHGTEAARSRNTSSHGEFTQQEEDQRNQAGDGIEKTVPSDSSRFTQNSLPNYKPLPLRWPYQLLLLLCIAGVFAFFEYEIRILPTPRFEALGTWDAMEALPSSLNAQSSESSVTPPMPTRRDAFQFPVQTSTATMELTGSPTIPLPEQMQQTTRFLQNRAKLTPSPDPSPRPPESDYPDPDGKLYTYLGWGPPVWVESKGPCETCHFISETIPIFYTDDHSWCPVQYDWRLPLKRAVDETQSNISTRFLRNSYVTPDEGCASIINVLFTYHLFWVHSTQAITDSFPSTWETTTWTASPPTPVPWLLPTTDSDENILLPLSTAGPQDWSGVLRRYDVFGNEMQSPYLGLRPAYPLGSRTLATDSVIWWTLPMSRPNATPRRTMSTHTDPTSTLRTSVSLTSESEHLPTAVPVTTTQLRPEFSIPSDMTSITEIRATSETLSDSSSQTSASGTRETLTSDSQEPSTSTEALPSDSSTFNNTHAIPDVVLATSPTTTRSLESGNKVAEPLLTPTVVEYFGQDGKPVATTTVMVFPLPTNFQGPVPGHAQNAFRTLSQADFVMASIIPILLTTLLSMLIQLMSSSFTAMLPFRVLGYPNGGTSIDSLLISGSGLDGQYYALRFLYQNGDPLPILNTLLAVMSAALVPLSSETIHIEFRPEFCSNRARVCPIGIRKSVAPSRAAEVMLGLMGFITVAMAFLLHRWRSGVPTEPWSIASMAGLLQDEKLRELFRSLPTPTRRGQILHRRQMLDTLGGHRYRLARHQNGEADDYGICIVPQGEDQGSLRSRIKSPPKRYPKRNPSKDYNSILHRLSIRANEVSVRLSFLLFLCGVLILILYYENTILDTSFESFMDSERFGVRFLFATLGTLITLFWDSYFTCKCGITYLELPDWHVSHQLVTRHF
jgi:hypothetical protein